MNTFRLRNTSKGFTVVELLIVIVVIAILAAITIVSYSAITQNAKKQDVATDAQTMRKELTKYKAEHGGLPTSLDDIEDAAATKSTFQYNYDATTKTYCLTASVDGASAYVTSANGAPQEGGCPGHGVDGSEAVTNLVLNPRPTTNYWFSSSTSTGTVSYVGSGENSAARSTRVTTGAYALYSNRTNAVSVAQAGDTYTVIFTIVSSISTTVTFQVGYGSSTAIISALSRPVTLSAGVPQTVRHEFTIPSGFDGQPIFNKFLWSAGAANDSFDVSKVMWVKGSYQGAYADGASANWVWNGTPNAATSTGPAL